MKKHLFVALAMLLSILGATAQTFTSGDFEFRICTDNDGNPTTDVAVTRCLLEENADVVIPETVSYNDTEYTVTTIKTLRTAGFKSLHLSRNIKSIGSCGISYFICENFSCDIDNPYFTTLNNGLYTKDLSTLIAYPINLENLTTPNETQVIGEFALSQSHVKNVVLNDGLKEIGKYAFQLCKYLSYVYIPESLEKIGDSAFLNCTNLRQSIYIPSALKFEYFNQFSGCPIEEYVVSHSNPYYSSYDKDIYTKDYSEFLLFAAGKDYINFHPETNKIGQDAFDNCGIENLIIPEHINHIAQRAFYGSKIKSIRLPNTISKIFNQTFYNCENLKQINIPSSVVEIGRSAFTNCKSLEYVTIPKSVKYIDVSIAEGSNAKIIIYSEDINLRGTIPSESISATFYAKGSTYQKLLDAFDNNRNKLCLLWTNFGGPDAVTIGPNSSYKFSNGLLYDPANGLQFDITMPEGLSLSDISTYDDQINSSWTELSDGRYRVVAYTVDGCSFPYSDLEISLSSDERLKRSEILFHNIIYSIADTEYSLPDETRHVSGYDIIFPELNEIEEGDTFELPNPLSEQFEDVRYSWGSNDNTIVKIDENNVLHALRPGETQIYRYINDPQGYIPTKFKWITVTPALWGDADGNGTIDIADVVATVNYILERNPEQFNAKLADVDRNGRINIVDLTAIVKLVIAQPAPDADGNSPAGAPALSELAFSEPTIDADGRRHISLEIEPSADYTALQTDIELPEGVAVEAVALADGFSHHSLDYAAVSPTSTRVVIYSPALVEVAAGERTGVIDITLSASDEARGTIRATRAVACDTEGHSYTLAAAEAELNNTTGLSSAAGAQASARALPGGVEVTAPEGMAVRISDVAGRVIADYSAGGAPRFHALAPGVYAVSFEGAATAKVLVK